MLREESSETLDTHDGCYARLLLADSECCFRKRDMIVSQKREDDEGERTVSRLGAAL